MIYKYPNKKKIIIVMHKKLKFRDLCKPYIFLVKMKNDRIIYILIKNVIR